MNRLISIQDLTGAELHDLVVTGQRVSAGELDFSSALEGRLVGLYFSKPSTRTRTSFFSAVHRMGGSTIVYSAEDLQLTTGETLEDTGMVLGLYLDALVMRTNGLDDEMEAVASGGIPVVNALSKAEHPTQAIADLITIRQEFGELGGRHVLYVGGWNNTTASLVYALSKMPRTTVTVATPAEFGPAAGQLDTARRNASENGSTVNVTHDPSALPRGVDVVYTSRWQTMGEVPSDAGWLDSFRGFRVTTAMMDSVADADTIFMHDLPAHRGSEVDAEVLDSPRSRIRRQAFNKMISAMCVLEMCLRGRRAQMSSRQTVTA